VSWVEITGYYGPGGDVVIPSVIDGLPVTSIADNAFYCCDTITSVTVPDSVTYIGYGAFTLCRSMTSATIGNGVTELEGTFVCCFILQSVTIGNNVTKIGDSAFAYCYGLSSIAIPANVTTVDKGAFAYCFDLESIRFEGNAPVLEAQWDYMRSAISTSAPLTAYFYHGATGFSLPSWNGIPSVMLPRAPSAPQDLMVKSGDGYATLYWDAPEDDGGAAVDQYVVYMNGTENATVTGTTANITGLVNGVDYTFAVAAHNEAGVGAPSDESLATPQGQLLKVAPPTGTTEKVGSVDLVNDVAANEGTNRAVFLGGFGLIVVASVVLGIAVSRAPGQKQDRDKKK
jgi:hypothetical protein